MTQRWNDLLFAHWPIAAAKIQALLPDWLEADTIQGSAWLGAVPFWLDRIKIRGVPAIPGLRNFPDLNLRTYVRDRITGTPGFYCFSVDSSNLLTVAVAHLILPPAVLPCRNASGAALGAGVLVLQPSAVFAAASDL
ncbi:MAG: DUF2071 domain-containing protein [Terracidiphilus sp.]